MRQDAGLANRWFQRAAEQGNADAQHNLAYNYYMGKALSKAKANWSANLNTDYVPPQVRTIRAMGKEAAGEPSGQSGVGA